MTLDQLDPDDQFTSWFDHEAGDIHSMSHFDACAIAWHEAWSRSNRELSNKYEIQCPNCGVALIIPANTDEELQVFGPKILLKISPHPEQLDRIEMEEKETSEMIEETTITSEKSEKENDDEISHRVFTKKFKVKIQYRQLKPYICCVNCKYNAGTVCNHWYPFVFEHDGFESVCDYYVGNGR